MAYPAVALGRLGDYKKEVIIMTDETLEDGNVRNCFSYY